MLDAPTETHQGPQGRVTVGVDTGVQAGKWESCFGYVVCSGNITAHLEGRALMQLVVGRHGWSLCFCSEYL